MQVKKPYYMCFKSVSTGIILRNLINHNLYYWINKTVEVKKWKRPKCFSPRLIINHDYRRISVPGEAKLYSFNKYDRKSVHPSETLAKSSDII